MVTEGYYVPLQEITDVIDTLNGETYNDTAQSLITLGYELHNNTPTTYPDLVNAEPFTVTIGGQEVVAEVFGGRFPPIPTRPRP